jgi:CheY-like chemotaxis protein
MENTDRIKRSDARPGLSVEAVTARAPRTILLIEDDEDLLILEQIILESEGYIVLTAQSAAEACDVLSLNARPDLVLLDMNLDDMSGLEFLEMLAKKHPDLTRGLPVVFVSGMDCVPHDRCIGFVRKPILDLNKFLEEIQKLIELGYRARHLPH